MMPRRTHRGHGSCAGTRARVAPTLLAVVAAATFVVAPSPARAYPQTIGKGYARCAACHYTPAGGGMPNSYGSGTLSATLPDDLSIDTFAALRESLTKRDVTGYDESDAVETQWDAGLDSRFLVLRAPTEVGGDPQALAVPMLLEAIGVFAHGPLLAYASVSPRRTSTERRPDAVFSREHWIALRLGPESSVRAGRMVLPLGLRIADHTQYTRELQGLDKWGQTYALTVDHAFDALALTASVVAGDFTLPYELRQHGALVSVGYSFGERAVVTASGMAFRSALAQGGAAALGVRARLVHRAYVLGEGSWREEASRASYRTQPTFAGYSRIGWFARESLDLYAEWGGFAIPRYEAQRKLRYGGGADWTLLPWLELAPAVLFEEDVESGMRWTYLAQVHLFY